MNELRKKSRTLFLPPSDRHLRMGDQYLSEHRISAGAFRDIPIGEDFWSCGPQDNRMWQWTIHSFLPLDGLLAIKRWDEVERLIASWDERFSSCPIGNDFPWHDHATALRLDRISRFAIEAGVSRFSRVATQHANILLRDDFYSKHTNHGFDQAVSLVLASVAFPNEEASDDWKRVGLKRLRDEIAVAFTKEGVHIENSPGYHAGMLVNLERAAMVSEAAGSIEPLFDLAFLEGAVEFLAWAMRPDRFLSYLGDTTRTRGSVPRAARQTSAYQHFLFAQTGGTEGKPPDATSRIFEKSGYAFYRSRWTPWAGHVHLAVKSGFLSRYHRQDDDLNVLLYAHGEEWLIDSGLYNHNQNDPVRVYMRSAEAHNVPFPEGVKAGRSAIGKAGLRGVEGSTHPFCVEARTGIYPGFEFVRRVAVTNDGRVQLQDRVKTKSSEQVIWLFHVPADKHISTSPGKARIVGSNMTLMIRVADEKKPKTSVFRGLDGPIRSVTSTKPNEMAPSQVVMFGPTVERELRFVMTFQK